MSEGAGDGLYAGIFAAAAALVGAFVGARATGHAAQRQIEAEHVIAERAKWRDKLREAIQSLSVDCTPEKVRRVSILLELNTNPYDPKDVAIVAAARAI